MIENSLQLVQAAQHGDIRAVEQLYSQTYKAAYLTAKSIVQNQDDAPPLVKDCYLQAFYNINTIPNPAQFDKWFNTIVAQKSKEYLLGKNPQLFSKDNAANASMWNDDKSEIAAGSAPELFNSAMNAIYALPSDQKLIVIMYYNLGFNTKEIADALSISEDEVKGSLFAAKQSFEQGFSTAGSPAANTASVIFSSLNSASQSCMPPVGQLQDIVGTLTGSNSQNANAQPAAPVNPQTQNVQNTSAAPYPNAQIQKGGISKGAKIAIIAVAAAAVVAIVAIILIIVFSSNSSDKPASTEPTYESQASLIEETTEATEDINEEPAANDVIYDESYALPSNYKVSGASFDKKNGYDSGLGIDEKKTIEEFEKLPEIKEIVDDDDAYIRYSVSQSDGASREIHNYYGGDTISYSVFINTDSGCVNPTRISLIFNSKGTSTALGDLRKTAKSALETLNIDEAVINALLYSDRTDAESVEAKDSGLGNYYFTNDIHENQLSIYIYYFPRFSQGTVEGLKAKYYETDTSKYFDVNTLFNNKDVDFNNDLTKEGIGKYISVNAAKKIDSEDFSSTISYTTDQNGEITEVEYSFTDYVIFEGEDGSVLSATVDFDYSYDDLYETEASMDIKYGFSNNCKTKLSDASKLAYEKLTFFDKDFPISEKELLLNKDGEEKELAIKSSVNSKKSEKLAARDATLEISEDDDTVSYEIEWEFVD